MGVGPWQLAVIVLLVLLLFGASRLGEIGRGLGEGVRAFRKSMKEGDGRRESDEEDEDDEDDEDDPEPPARLRGSGSKKRRSEDAVQNKRHVMAKRRKRAEEDDERS